MFCSIYSFVNKEKSIFIKDSLISKGNLYFNIFAGFPPTIAYGGTSFTTTAPAATIAPRPIVTPDKIKALVAIKHHLPLLLALLYIHHPFLYYKYFLLGMSIIYPQNDSLL